MHPSYSIIIVAYNQPHLVERCLESIMKNGALISQTREVILVNNGPKRARLPDQHEQFIRVINNDKNVGFGRAVNQAAEIAHGEYLFLLNSDAVLMDDTVKNLTRFICNHPHASIIGTQQKTTRGELVASFGKYPNAWRELAALTGVSKVAPIGRLITPTPFLRNHYKVTRQQEWVSGGSMLIKKSVFDRVGGFDPMYFLYVDDIDLCQRVRAAGGEVWFCADALVTHDYGSSGTRDSAQRYTTRGLLYFAKKNGQAVKPLEVIQAVKQAIRT